MDNTKFTDIFAEKKMWVAFANAKATHIFQQKKNIYAIFNGQRFNDTLTNGIVSFEQLGPGSYVSWSSLRSRPFSQPTLKHNRPISAASTLIFTRRCLINPVFALRSLT